MKAKLTKNIGEIDVKSMLKADSYEELIDKIDTRLKKKYSSSKVKWVWKIQRLFENHDVITDENNNMTADYTRIHRMLEFTIQKKAEWYEKRYYSVRLSYHDFEAELWKITYDAIEYYEQSGDIDTEFTLVETLELYWKFRMKDFIKSCLYTEKNKPWYTAAPLADEFDEFWADESLNPEQMYLVKETVTEMFNESSLTEKERLLLTVIYDYPSGSFREWGKEMGINHPETVRRMLKSLQMKINRYVM